MAKPKKQTSVKKPTAQSFKKKETPEEIEAEIQAVKKELEIKKSNVEPTQAVEQTQTEPTEVTEQTTPDGVKFIDENQNITADSPAPVEEKKPDTIENNNNISISSDLAENTQEDFDKKTTLENVTDFTSSDNITERVEGLTSDEFPTNEGATEEEDTPEYRREMSKIKASALVEFFDVVFMIICLIISKDFSDKNQEKFTLVKTRKNAIKANVFQIMAFSKKKHNPMGTLVFLIIFSYVPLVVIAIMERIKQKKAEQEKREREQAEEALMRYNAQFATPQPQPFVNPPQHDFKSVTERKKSKGRPKIVHVEKNSGHEVKKLKNGTYKNLTTGQIYGGGRGRQPLWVKQYIGKIG